ncbi:CarD family transcriptional regulator [Thalassospira mesophila]|uniref:CarD family transcriptional regulator n=1 Tax=Thalassospira mesophila TaxID=1293891 RepID=A0A1Y2L4S0_9PROT|nr:CarD family transcriptional regulator [Thalassospira mesophila]OSQ40836.1 CarD family transcriptional regulator [Thalassospira mesophila]
MSDKLPFTIGDFVVYPAHGVGCVDGLETQAIAGQELRLYVITFESSRMTLRVPVNKVGNSGLRKLSSKKEMDSALITLRGRARVKRTMWSRRAQEYEAKINSGDPVSIAEVVRDLHRSATQPEQSFSERQIYEAAFERLVDELAAIEKIDKDKASGKLEKLLQKAA